MYSIKELRDLLSDKFINKDFITDKTGVKVVEVVGCSFLASETSIFGSVNLDYANREIQWYESQSRYVKDIPGKTPEIWNNISSSKGMINSNYGWCVFSEENGNQYSNVLNQLKENPNSRRASMLYTRPSMHTDYNKDGMSDFMCTHAVDYLIRDNKVHAIVKMRSADLIFGYKNDRHWQQYLLEKLSNDLKVDVGNIYWNASSAHIYERHFYLIDNYIKTGVTTISKKEYEQKYA